MSKIGGNGCEILVPFNERKPLKEIEHSITKRYRTHIWSRFVRAISEYHLVEEGDKVAVAVSGGKDSLLMAKIVPGTEKTLESGFSAGIYFYGSGIS